MNEDATPQSEIVLYQTEDGRTRVECRFENETIWLTQKLMAELWFIRLKRTWAFVFGFGGPWFQSSVRG